MPFTPYHVGPSGFFGLLLRRWLDVPMVLLVNVLIDTEVLAANHFSSDWRVHQFLHFHTLLVGGLAGAALGALFYFLRPLRRLCELGMALIGLPQKARLWPMVIGGLLGAWLHILIDSVYHYDVQIFWPYAKNPVQRWLYTQLGTNVRTLQGSVKTVCLVFWGLLAVLYLFLLFKKLAKTWKSKS